MPRVALLVTLILLAAAVPPRAQAPPSAAEALRTLPSYMTLLQSWGQRPEWEKDSRHVLFMEKAFGDAYRIDIKTGRIEPLTTHFFHSGFDRIHQLANGDYLLTGTSDFDPKDPWKNRHRLEMFILDKSLTKPPVDLKEFIDEGPAVSLHKMHLAWTAPGQRDMYIADIVYTDGVPSLKNKRLLLSYADRPKNVRLETQDFRLPDERELIYTCYSGTDEEPFYYADVCGLDLETGAITDYTKTPGGYDEAEGIFPGGRHTIVESDRHTEKKRGWQIDLYRLALDGSNRAERLTHFNDIGSRYHGSNGDVSPDGRYVVLQLGIHGMGAGQGKGLLLIDLQKWEETLRR
jgi:hypothetical protein